MPFVCLNKKKEEKKISANNLNNNEKKSDASENKNTFHPIIKEIKALNCFITFSQSK